MRTRVIAKSLSSIDRSALVKFLKFHWRRVKKLFVRKAESKVMAEKEKKNSEQFDLCEKAVARSSTKLPPYPKTAA